MIGTLNKEQTDEILADEYIMRIGFQDDTKMHILPVTYCYDKSTSSIIGHSGPGTKIDAMRENPDVCFEIEHIETISKWKTVVGWGKFEELKGADARNSVHLLVNKVRSLVKDDNHPHMKFLRDISNSNGSESNSIMYRIRISECTGKFEDR